MRTLIVLLLTGVVAFATVFAAVADTTMLANFTQSELDANWEPDRQAPSDGVTSVTAFGRDDVARIGIDSSATQPGDFQRTEGIKTINPVNFGDGVHVDLYLDPAWQDKAVRAGLWVVGDDGAGDRDNLFAIIEFVNNEPCAPANCSNQANIADHEGWRIWDSLNGWTLRDTEFEYGQWYTLAIELDPVSEEYRYFIDRQEVGTGPGGQNFVREVFLNSYNYGADSFPTLSSDNYAAHWHAVEQLVRDTTFPLCANLWNGQLHSPLNGVCPPNHFELPTPSTQPLAFCVNYYSGGITFAGIHSCNPVERLHVVPDNGDLVTCVNLHNGRLKHAFSPAQCGQFEFPMVIEVG